MSTRYINTVNRTLKIVADILNSKPRDWNPDGLEGSPADQFETVFTRLYEQAQDTLNCHGIDIKRQFVSEDHAVLHFYMRDVPTRKTIIRLSHLVVADWSSRT